MRHQDTTINHILESWSYANAAARTSATGFVPGDIGRIAFQQDASTYWRLTATTPTWIQLVNNVVESFTYANAAGRTGATGFVAGDVGKLAYQTDTAQYWRLFSQTSGVPTWLLIAPNNPETWVYATATDRNTATGFVVDDVGRLAFQTDTGQYWRLASQASGVPTWAIFSPLESFTYANAAARTGATGFKTWDVGRIAYQSDTGQYWRLVSQAAGVPTWLIMSNPSSSSPTYASLQVNPTNPAGTTSTAGVMMGLGGVATITPTATGKVLITVTGNLGTSGAFAASTTMRYGTGTAPANGAALTGTVTGSTAILAGNTASFTIPFSLSAVKSGLAIGTAIWIDLAVATNNVSSTASVANLTVTALELP